MLSVVIPTHNRSESAVRLAKEVDSQECSLPFEVIFVLDGCRDDTRNSLESLSWRHEHKLIETPGLGAAGARNRGAEKASGDHLLFIDDDVIPHKGTLEAHIQTLAKGDKIASVGPYPYAPEHEVNPIDFAMREWWREYFLALADPSHKSVYTDCLTGNFALRKDDFLAVGSFDQAFKTAREDYELGVRLLNFGVEIKYTHGASAYHYPISMPKSVLKKCYSYGLSDILFARKHDEAFSMLPVRRFCRHSKRMRYILKALEIFGNERFVGILGSYFEKRLERLWDPNFQRRWHQSRGLAYQLGVISGVGGLDKLQTFVSQWIDPTDIPKSVVNSIELDTLSPFAEISEATSYDYYYAISRIGDSIAGWSHIPSNEGFNSISGREIAKHVIAQSSWDIWRELILENDSENDADMEAWKELKRFVAKPKELPSSANKTFADFDVCNFLITKERDRVSIPETQTVYLHEEGNLIPKIGQALSLCKKEFIAIFSAEDQIDVDWKRSVARHFSDPSVSCVITPVVRNEIITRGDELFHSFADFVRVRDWKSCCLNDELSPAAVLMQFPGGAHRLVMHSSVLESLVSSFGSVSNLRDLNVLLLSLMARRGQRIVYEPRAVVWKTTELTFDEISETACAQAFEASRIFSQMLKTKGGRISTAKLYLSLMKAYLKKPWKSARGYCDWPLSIALDESRSAFKGAIAGLTFKEPPPEDIPINVHDDGRAIWVS